MARNATTPAMRIPKHIDARGCATGPGPDHMQGADRASNHFLRLTVTPPSPRLIPIVRSPASSIRRTSSSAECAISCGRDLACVTHTRPGPLRRRRSAPGCAVAVGRASHFRARCASVASPFKFPFTTCSPAHCSRASVRSRQSCVPCRVPRAACSMSNGECGVPAASSSSHVTVCAIGTPLGTARAGQFQLNLSPACRRQERASGRSERSGASNPASRYARGQGGATPLRRSLRDLHQRVSAGGHALPAGREV